MDNVNTNIIFSTKVNGKEIYVERFDFVDRPKYQAFYDSGEVISELESDSNVALMAAGKEIERITK